MLTGPHQREFNLILDVFNVKGSAARLPPNERPDNMLGESGNNFADPCRSGTLTAADGNKCLCHGDRDLPGFKADNGAIAADDLVIRERCSGAGLTLCIRHFAADNG